jgi:hypothetical protein
VSANVRIEGMPGSGLTLIIAIGSDDLKKWHRVFAESADPQFLYVSSSVIVYETTDRTKGVVRKYNLPTAATPAPAPVLFSGVNNGNLIVSRQSIVGATYQIQRSGDMVAWDNVGLPITGTGAAMNYSESSNDDELFLRVVMP